MKKWKSCWQYLILTILWPYIIFIPPLNMILKQTTAYLALGKAEIQCIPRKEKIFIQTCRQWVIHIIEKERLTLLVG